MMKLSIYCSYTYVEPHYHIVSIHFGLLRPNQYSSIHFGPFWCIYIRMRKHIFELRVIVLNLNLLKNIDLKLVPNSIKI